MGVAPPVFAAIVQSTPRIRTLMAKPSVTMA
jgi:hypothetical protein